MNIKKTAEEVTKVTKTAEKAFEKLAAKQKLSAKETEAALKSLDKYGKKSVKAYKDIGSAVEDTQDGVSQLTAMFKAPAKDLISQAKHAGAYAERMKDVAAKSAKLPGILGAAGKAAGAMGVAVGGVSKLMLDWPGLVLMGLKMIIDAATKIDTYIKGMNKKFAMVRGPEIMTKDVDKQFRDFSLAVTDIASNIRDGLRSDEVNEFMQSIDQAGKRIGTLNEGFYSYRDAVHVAAKASKNLGIDMVRSGAMMSTMMMDFRMNLTDVDKAFVQVAFDAEKSGLSTDRFWNAVQNATHSLAFYGKFINEISNTTKVFAQSQVTGADDALDSAQRIMKSFSGMTETQRMGFMAIAKRADFSKLFKEEADKATVDLQDIEMKIRVEKGRRAGASGAEKEGIDKELIKLETERAAQEQKIADMTKAAMGDFIAQAQMLPTLTGKAVQVSMKAIEGITGRKLEDIDPGADLLAVTQAIQTLNPGMTEMDVRNIINMAKGQARLLNNSYEEMKKGSAVSGEDSLKLLKGIGGLNEKSKTFSEDLDALSEDYSKQYNITKDQAKAQLIMVASNKNIKDLTKQLLTETDPDKAEDIIKQLKTANIAAHAGSKNLEYELNDLQGGTEAAQGAYDDTFDKIRDNTLSIEDMKKIGKDGAMAQLMYLSVISSWVGKIANHVLGKEDAKARKEAFKNLPKDIKKSITEGSAAFGIGGVDPKRVSAEIAKQLTKKREAEDVVKTSDIAGKAVGGIELFDLTGGKDKKSQDQAKKNTELAKKMVDTQLKMLKGKTKKSPSDVKLIGELEYLQTLEGDNFKKEAVKLKQKYTTDKINAEIQIQKAIDNIDQLKLISGSSIEMAKLQAADVMGDPTKLAALAEGLIKGTEKEAKGKPISFETLTVGLPEPVKNALEKYYDAANMFMKGETPTGGRFLKPIETKQGLRTPEKAITPGSVVVHPPEVIMPAKFADFMPKTMMMGGVPGAAAGGVAGGKTITITINATERDMAQRIGNEVRGIMHKESL